MGTKGLLLCRSALYILRHVRQRAAALPALRLVTVVMPLEWRVSPRAYYSALGGKQVVAFERLGIRLEIAIVDEMDEMDPDVALGLFEYPGDLDMVFEDETWDDDEGWAADILD